MLLRKFFDYREAVLPGLHHSKTRSPTEIFIPVAAAWAIAAEPEDSEAFREALKIRADDSPLEVQKKVAENVHAARDHTVGNRDFDFRSNTLHGVSNRLERGHALRDVWRALDNLAREFIGRLVDRLIAAVNAPARTSQQAAQPQQDQEAEKNQQHRSPDRSPKLR